MRWMIVLFALVLSACATTQAQRADLQADVAAQARAQALQSFPAAPNLLCGQIDNYRHVCKAMTADYYLIGRVECYTIGSRQCSVYPAKGVAQTGPAKAATPTSSPTYTAPSSGTVHVKGYYRKDGTYVQPHTRSKPKK